MSELHNPDLIRAYDLIEDDQLEEARAILDSYLEDHQNDADAWWLYAHAVTEPIEAQNALRNVLRIDPTYPEAKALLEQTEAILTPKARTASISQLSSHLDDDDDVFDMKFGEAPDFLDRLDDDEFDNLGADDDFSDEFDFEEDITETGTSKRRWLLLLPIFAILLVVLAGILLSNRPNTPTVVENTPAASSTSDIAIVATATDALILSPDSTDEAPATQPGDFPVLETALSAYSLVGAEVEQTSIGNVFVATVCNDSSIGLINTALGVMDIIAQEGVALADAPDYVGTRIVDCNRDNFPLRSLGISYADAQAFAENTLSLAELRSKLQVLPLN